MPIVIVVGVQWGDEGKGKVVDYLTERASLVVRFQGGNNAGHTVIVEGKKTALKLIPSGILRPGSRCLLASGVVLDLEALFSEIESLREAGVEVSPQRLGVAGEAKLILPYHKAIDGAREAQLADSKIGTTGKGIGPAYEDAVSRYAIRVADLLDRHLLETLVRRNVEEKNLYLKAVLNSPVQFDADELLESLLAIGLRIKPYLSNVSLEIARAEEKDQYIVFEGAQGCLLDINHGTYPFVTSSNTLSGYACVSGGFGPKKTDLVLGICKAYATRVGAGPFPTEDLGEIGERLREVGKEFGTVTGRPRRCGWFDGVAVRRTGRLNGIDSLIITKLDVLSGLEVVKLCTGYELDGKVLEDLPVIASDIERVQARYEELPGWKEDITAVKDFSHLPGAAQNLLRRIEEIAACKVSGFSVGPDREQTIVTDEKVRRYALL